MTKKIVTFAIDECRDCPHSGTRWVYDGWRRMCNKQRVELANFGHIPNWCPLEDEETDGNN